jgi:asparagine N-glycosylation enzyme membrane subunit Stt3
MTSRHHKATKQSLNLTPDYLLLFLGLGLGFAGFMMSWPHTLLQQLWIFYLAAFYILWGVVHHIRTDSLHKKVVAEYVGVAILLTAALTLSLQY